MTKLFRYQQQGVNMICLFDGRALLADEMGLGKSIQSLAYGVQKGIRPILVICPAGLKINWARESATHFNLRSEILEERKPKRLRRLSFPPVTIINYEILAAWEHYIKVMNPQLVIVDEAHYVKNKGSKRTKVTARICKRAPHCLLLTGTPIVNRPAELWSLLRMIDPVKYKSFIDFGMRYCKPKRTFWGWEFKGAQRMDELHLELSESLMIRRLTSEVLHQLPKQRQSIIGLPLSDRKQYDMASTNFAKWLSRFDPAGASRAQRAERLVWWSRMRRLAGELKLPAVKEWIQSVLDSTGHEKMVVFGIHHSIIEELHAEFPNSVMITGKITGKKRQKSVDEFQSRKQTRLLFGNIQAAGVGLNLTAARRVAFCEYGWTPAEHAQAAARIHRIGQTSITDCYYLIAHDTVEEKIAKIIQSKQSISDSAIDGRKLNKLEIMDLLEQAIQRKGRA